MLKNFVVIFILSSFSSSYPFYLMSRVSITRVMPKHVASKKHPPCKKVIQSVFPRFASSISLENLMILYNEKQKAQVIVIDRTYQ